MYKILILLFLFQSMFFSQSIKRLGNAHSHNDYHRENPLFDALNNGFLSIEADIFLIEDELFVAHDKEEIKDSLTLESVYLDPIKEIILDEDSQYKNLFPIILLIDIKTDALPTYKILEKQLKKYDELLTKYTGEEKVQGKVNIVISGNRPIDYLSKKQTRLAAIDGRIENIEEDANLFPLISDNVSKLIKDVRNPDSIKTILLNISKTINSNRKIFRIWGAPDNEESWQIQYEANLNLIGTDNPELLRDFLIKKTKENN